MILNFGQEVAKFENLLKERGIVISDSRLGLEISFLMAEVYSRGMAFERERVLGIIARKAINAADLRSEINRPVR